MKTAKRRVLSFLMALFVMVTTVCGHVDYTVAAETTASTIAAWEYTAAPENGLPAAATTGNGTLSLTDGTTLNATAFSSKSLCALPWTVDAGWIMSVDASTYSELKFTASLRSSGTGPGKMELQYSLDNGTTWTDIADSTVTLSKTLTELYSAFSLPSALNDAAFLLKVNVAEDINVNGTAIASGGTSNINNIIITGVKEGTGSTDSSQTPGTDSSQAPDTSTDNTDSTESTTGFTVTDGTYVIYNPANGVALSQTYAGYNNTGVAMTLKADGTFDSVAITEIWTVRNNTDGTVTISCPDGKLSMDTSYQTTPLDKVNDTWVLEKAGTEGTCYIKNVGRTAYLEWYNEKFSTYSTIGEGKEDLFEMQFIAVEAPKVCASVKASLSEGTVEAGRKVALTCSTEGATIYYNTDGSENYVAYTDVIAITADTTIKAYAKLDNYLDSEVSTFKYTVRNTTTPLATGDKVVFYNDANGVVLTTTNASGKLKGVKVTKTDQGTLQVVKTDNNKALVDAIAVLDVTLDENGYYTFTNNGKYLTTGSTGSALSFADAASDYSLWQIYESKTDGEYLLKNVNATYKGNPQYIEYFSNFTTFSLYPDNKDDSAYETVFCAAPTVVAAPSNPTITPAAGEVVSGTTVTITNNTEGATIYYTVDGSDPSKADNTARAEYTSETVIKITEECTVKAVAYKDGLYGDVVSAKYTFEPAVADGTYVIYNPAHKKLLSSLKTGYYNVGIDMTIEDVTAKVTANATELWTVTNNSDGTVTITGVDGVLSLAASNSSLQNNEVNDKWVIEKNTDGTFYIKNVGRGNYIEWYAEKGNWSTYWNYSGSEDLFKVQFVKATDGLGRVTSAEDFTTGTYVMVVESGYAPGALSGKWIDAVKPTIVGNKVTDAQGGIWTLTVSDGTVKITDSNFTSIAPMDTNDNGIKAGAYDWTWTFDDTTGTFRFTGKTGTGTAVTLVSYKNDTNHPNGFRALKDTSYTSNTSAYYRDFTLYKVEKPKAAEPTEGSKVVIYNVNAEGVLAGQDDNVESPSINSAKATIGTDGKVTAANGGVVFEVKKNGDYFRFYNAAYGYLCSKDAGNNAYYSLEACDEADWTLESLDSGFKMKNKVAKYNNTGAQYLEYYSDSYKTYSFYGTNKDGTPADTTIYEFRFLECANTNLTEDVVNAPEAVVETVLDANVGLEYTFTFEVDAPFGVKELAVAVNGEAIAHTEAAGIYKVVIPAEKVLGEKLTIVVSGKDNKEVAITGTFEVTVKDEPVVANMTPAANSETADNKKPVISADIINAGENATVTMTINEEAVNATYADGKVTYTSATDMADGRYSVTVTVTRADGKTVTKTWAFTVGKADFQLYFGQLHSHTTYSDGSGTLASALEYIASLPESANVDFVAFTDHSNYFDESGNANPAEALYDMSKATATSQTKWNEYKDAIAEFNAKKLGVVALGGFEMTWSGGPGHINTFNTPGIVSRNNKTLNNKTKDAGMKAYYALLNQAEGVDSLSQFNHPGSTFGTFTDFAYWDAVLDTRIQMVEVGNGEGAIGSGGYFPSYEYYTMALDKGWHLAPTNNQDNHKGKWGNANDARDVILTDDFSEEGIYKAIREMRMYATEDKNLEIYYTLNGLQLGSTISEVPEKVTINVNVYDPDATDKISKVEVIVNSGKVAYTWDDATELAKGELTCELDSKYSYYYIRVTQDDGDLAVTSPVWVGETLKLGISSVECGTSYPVTDEEAVITTRIFNSENESAFVKSLTYTINGSEVVKVDTTGYNVAALSTTDIEFKYTPTVAKITKLTVTAVVEHDNESYTFTMDISLDVQDASKLSYIGIDAAHYNEYVAGNYADSMGNFSELAGEYSVRTVELKTSEELIAACSNSKYKALILTAPSRRLAASWTDARTYSDAEIAAIKTFNENGGTVIFSGWSDHYESPDKTGNTTGLPFEHMAATQNEVLEALGSSIRISDDATYDDVRSAADGVDQWRLYFNTYGDNYLTEGVIVDEENPYNRFNTEVFSHYGGASIYVVDGEGNATTTLPSTVSPVVFGHSTTYSVDADNDNLGGDTTPKYAYKEGDNRLMVMAMEQIEGKGEIIVSGAAFMSNFEVQAELDNTLEKNYSNYRICENLVSKINPITITPIAEVQAQTEVGYKYTIEGIVTTNASGYDKDTAFFDCIYVQDETGGVCCFPVAGNYKIGDKVRVTGTTEFYQGEMELQVSSIEVIGSGTVTSKSVTAAQINDLSVLGQLVTLTGKVVSFEMANGLVQTIMVQDAAGNVARVFIDGYITTGKDVQNLAVGRTITVTGISSYDDTFNAPDGPFPRIRVKDRSDVICTAGSTGGSSSSGDSSYTPDEEETTEVPSTEAPTTKPGTSTQKPSTEENTTTTPSTEPVEVIIPVDGTVAEQTEAIVEAIEEVKAGNDVVIKVEDTESGEVAVSIEVFKALEDNKVDLVVELANGFTWTIDASTVDTNKVEAGLKAIDLWVEIVEAVVPAELVKETAGENTDVREISLKHNGEFGFTAALDVPLGKEFAGRNATLYYFNPEANALEAQELVTIDEFGKARFTFTHASDYVVVIENAAEEAPVDTEVNTEAPVDTEGSTEGSANAEEKGGSPVVGIVLVLLVVAAGCFIFAYSKKKK